MDCIMRPENHLVTGKLVTEKLLTEWAKHARVSWCANCSVHLECISPAAAGRFLSIAGSVGYCTLIVSTS